MKEPLLDDANHTYSVLPIRHPDVFERYERAFASFWSPGEIDLSKDLLDWDTMTPDERHFVSHVLAFFAQSDGIVNDNLCQRFAAEVTMREARCFYGFQQMIEDVHNIVYSNLIATLIRDPAERARLADAVSSVPCVRRKAEWAIRWMESSAPFAQRLLAFAVVEGIFFSGSFCAVFWLKKRGLMPGLCKANTLIARDEGMHQEFATHLYRNHVVNKLPEDVVHALVDDAVAREVEFCCEALPVNLLGMNSQCMVMYIRFVADRLLTELGVSKLYNAANPFDWMESIALENKANFFEHRVTEYQKSGARNDGQSHTFALDQDF
jgi:ribonucleoside-diphosphate reductase beta chain